MRSKVVVKFDTTTTRSVDGTVEEEDEDEEVGAEWLEGLGL